MSVSTFSLTDADVQRLYKIEYESKSRIYADYNNVLTGSIRKSYNVGGKEVRRPLPMGISGGIGSGIIPDYNREPVEEAVFTTKSIYAVSEVDRRSLKLATDKSSYVKGLSYHVETAVRSFAWNWERQLFGHPSGIGALGTISSFTDQGSGVFDLVITTASWIQACWEKYLIVNIESGNTDKFVVSSVTPSTRTVRVSRISGSKVPAANNVVFLQNSEGNDMFGLFWASDNTGTKYGVTTQYRWQSESVNANSQALTGDVLDRASTAMQVARGQCPTHFFMHYDRVRDLKATLEGQKRYSLTPTTMSPNGEMNGKISWKGLEFMSSDGPVKIVAARFCPLDTVYGVYMPDLEICHASSGPSWVQEDGDVWKPLQRPNDGFYAYYATYAQTYLPPPSIVKISSLATS
jgi:hypothetical protein